MAPRRADIVAQAESRPDMRAGIARLADVLEAPSYRVPEGVHASSMSDEATVTAWPPDARSVLVLGLHHPDDDPRLDWWAGGHSPGDRQLMAICASLKQWLQDKAGIGALPVPYHVERGGVFLKDAAVLAGLGVMGRSNLVITPAWGPRVRFRAMLLDADLEPTGPLEGFSPCASCAEPCRLACPQRAFTSGSYRRSSCLVQMDADEANRSPAEGAGEGGKPTPVTKYCRACELACPVGA